MVQAGYNIELLYKKAPTFDPSLLLQKLEQKMEKIEVVVPFSPQNSMVQIAYPLLLDQINENAEVHLPLSHLFLNLNTASKSLSSQRISPDLDFALKQTFDWNEARSVVSDCRFSLLVNEMYGDQYPWITRLTALHTALSELLTIAPCDAIFWHPSQKVIHPDRYLFSLSEEAFDPLYAAFNIRLFNFVVSDDDSSQDYVMDTVGLSYFNLPDVQCHFHLLDPNTVARNLFLMAQKLFQRGDVFKDGDVINFSETEKWTCRREESLIEPKRVVIDLYPGADFAAGQYD